MEGWISDKLENLFETGSGTTPQSTNSNYYDGNINWLLTGDLNDGIITSTSKKITSKALSDYSTLKLYPKNSVVIALYGATIGKLGFLDIESTTNQACCVLFNSKRMEQKYLFYNLLFAKNRILALAVGGGQPNISQNIVKNFEISFPELQPEQQKIATILSTIDQTIAQTEQLIAKYKNIKQGLMHDLLTYGIDENGTIRSPQTHIFVEKKGLVVPEEWEVEELIDICQENGLVRGPFGGALKKEMFVEQGIKVYEQKNAIYRSINLGDYFIDHKKYMELKRFEVVENDFIVSCSGTIGKIFCIPKDFPKGIINQALLKISINQNKMLNGFFYKYFEWDNFQTTIIDNSQGGAMKNLIGMDKFKRTKISKPNILEQQKIVSILEKHDKLIESEQTNLAKLQKLKQGLMADLLTGKVRVKTESV